MSKFTPGPWYMNLIHGVPGVEAKYGIIAVTPAIFPHDDTRIKDASKANAALIASAPDLLAASKLGLMMLGVEAQCHRESGGNGKAEAVEGAMDVIRAAIAAAEPLKEGR